MPKYPDGYVAILVLAAGASRRMGEPKMVLPLDGEPMVRRAARCAVESGADQVVVVIPPATAVVRASLDGLALGIVETPASGGPISASIHTGLDAIDPQATSVLILLADMVRVTAAMLRDVVTAARQPDGPLVVSRYGSVTAPPLAIPRRYFNELRAATGDTIGKALVERHRASARFLDWPLEALHDIDTPHDYHEVVQG